MERKGYNVIGLRIVYHLKKWVDDWTIIEKVSLWRTNRNIVQSFRYVKIKY